MCSRYVNRPVKLILHCITIFVKLFLKIFKKFCFILLFLAESAIFLRSVEGILYYVYFFAQEKMPQKKREGKISYHTRI